MLNRLMFVYFIQKKGFLDGDPDYLQNRMRNVRQTGQNQFQSFYRYFSSAFSTRAGTRTQERELDEDLKNSSATCPTSTAGCSTSTNWRAQPRHRNHDKAFERLFDFSTVLLAPRRPPSAQGQRDQSGCPRLHLREVHQPEADGGLLHQGGHHRIHQQEHDYPVPVRRRQERVPDRFRPGGSVARLARRPQPLHLSSRAPRRYWTDGEASLLPIEIARSRRLSKRGAGIGRRRSSVCPRKPGASTSPAASAAWSSATNSGRRGPRDQ